MEENNLGRKYLEHISINWKVHLFSFSNQSNYSLRSCCFDADAAVPSRWYLSMEWHPSKNTDKKSAARLHLIRKPRFAGPEKDIRGSVRFGFVIEPDTYFYLDSYFGLLKKGSVWSTQSSIGIDYVTCVVSIICDLIIYNDPEPYKRSPFATFTLQVPHYKKTMHDYKDTQNITIEFKDGEIAANKKILFSSSKVLRSMIEQSKDNRIKIEKFSKKVMEQLIFYFYSNRPDFCTDYFLHFDLLGLAMELKVKSLIGHLVPKKILLMSENKSGGKEFIWKVSNFSLLKSKKYLQSSTFATDFSNAVTFCLKVFQNANKIGIFLQLINGRPEYDINVQISVLDNNERKFSQLTYSLPFSTNKVVGTVDWITKDPEGKFRSQFLVEDMLTIVCRVSHSNLQFISRLVEVWEYEETDADVEGCVSLNMPCLQIKEQHSDLALIVGDRLFSVHRAVLMFRSETFNKLLMTPTEELVYSEIPEKSMELILQYIYTGKLHLENVDVALEIYEASFKLNVDLLEKLCSCYLMSNISPVNSSSIYCKANEHQDSLKDQVLKHVLDNFPHVLTMEGWLDLKVDEEIKKFTAESLKNISQLCN